MRANRLWSASLVFTLVIALGVAGLATLFHFTDSQFVLSVFGIAVAVITASINYRAAKNKETNARLFADKREVYVDLVQTVMNLLHERKANPTVEEQAALVKKFQTLRTQLLVWGSAATVLALDKMGEMEAKPESAPANMTVWMAQLFAAIRKDLGHEDTPEESVELALGMLIPKDRAVVRAELKKNKK